MIQRINVNGQREREYINNLYSANNISDDVDKKIKFLQVHLDVPHYPDARGYTKEGHLKSLERALLLEGDFGRDVPLQNV